MTTILDSVLKRELRIGGEPYTLTISPEGFSLTVKGRRNGLDIAWADLIGGDAALATALNASLTANLEPRSAPAAKKGGQSRSMTIKPEQPRDAAAKLFMLPKASEKRPAVRRSKPLVLRDVSAGAPRKPAGSKSRANAAAKRVGLRKPAAKTKRK